MGQTDFAARLLSQELVVSIGCTEPAAIALAAAAAAAATKGPITSVLVRADEGTFKNSLAVGLPGTGLRGPAVAAAAGAVTAAPERRLQVLSGLDIRAWARAERLARRSVQVEPRSWGRVRIEARVEGARGVATAVVAGRHDRIVRVRGPEGALLPAAGAPADRVREAGIADSEIRRRLASAGDLIAAVADLEEEDLERVSASIEMNLAFAREALGSEGGLGLGRAWVGADGGSHRRDLSRQVKGWVAAGVEARMAGLDLPVMTSGGSGNSGLTVALGAWAAGRSLGIEDRERLLRATALGHLANVAVKARIGRVGPLCGGAIASAAGVACAITWLLGGGEAAIEQVLRHLGATTVGTLCDGAKPNCALKISGGLGVAVDAALLAVEGMAAPGRGGMAGADSASLFHRLERLAREVYPPFDSGLLPILTETDEPGRAARRIASVS